MVGNAGMCHLLISASEEVSPKIENKIVKTSYKKNFKE